MKKAYTASSDESMSEDSSSDSEYRQKLERYRQLETMRNKQQEEKFEEDEQPNIMKPKILEQTLKQPLKQPKSLGRPGVKVEQPITRSALFPTSRPTTSHSQKPITRPPLTKRVRLNDPVSRYQQMSTAWRKDLFLEKGANKKEGRKLALSERNRAFGLLY